MWVESVAVWVESVAVWVESVVVWVEFSAVASLLSVTRCQPQNGVDALTLLQERKAMAVSSSSRAVIARIATMTPMVAGVERGLPAE